MSKTENKLENGDGSDASTCYTEYMVTGNHPVYRHPTSRSMTEGEAEKYADTLIANGYRDVNIECVR